MDWEDVQPRYAAYCIANGAVTPDEMLERDRERYPGASGAGFVRWINQQSSKWCTARGLREGHRKSEQDHQDFTDWLLITAFKTKAEGNRWPSYRFFEGPWENSEAPTEPCSLLLRHSRHPPSRRRQGTLHLHRNRIEQMGTGYTAEYVKSKSAQEIADEMTALSDARIKWSNRAGKAEAGVREAIELFEMTAREPSRDPLYYDEVSMLGARIGYGALMSCAARAWMDDFGDEAHTHGPARASVLEILEKLKAVASPQPEKKT